MISRIIGWGMSGIVALLALTAIFGSWYTVDQGEVGVTTRNGAVTGVAQPGLHFKMPFFDDVFLFSTQTHTRTYGTLDPNDTKNKMQAYSKDRQTVDIKMSVTYRLDPTKAVDVYAAYGSVDNAVTRLIDPKVNFETKSVWGTFTAIEATQEAVRLNAEVTKVILGATQNSGILVQSVQTENFDFSDAYEAAVDESMRAQVAVFKKQQELEQQKVDAEKARVEAQGVADSQLAKAKAEAQGVEIRGNADAAAIRAKAEALRDNPLLVQFTLAERWNGAQPTTMLPGSSVPLLNINP